MSVKKHSSTSSDSKIMIHQTDPFFFQKKHMLQEQTTSAYNCDRQEWHGSGNKNKCITTPGRCYWDSTADCCENCKSHHGSGGEKSCPTSTFSYCKNPGTRTGKCVKWHVGRECTTNEDCQKDLYCKGASSTSSGTCQCITKGKIKNVKTSGGDCPWGNDTCWGWYDGTNCKLCVAVPYYHSCIGKDRSGPCTQSYNGPSDWCANHNTSNTGATWFKNIDLSNYSKRRILKKKN